MAAPLTMIQLNEMERGEAIASDSITNPNSGESLPKLTWRSEDKTLASNIGKFGGIENAKRDVKFR